MAQDPHKMDAQTYNSIVARANLRSIRLTTNRFDMKPEALDLDPDAWRNNISATMVQSYLEPESGSLYGILSYEVVCRQGRKRILSVSATYFVSYKIQGECDQAAGELFVERVGKVAAYPYFRTLVASLTSQAGLMMRPLPVLSFAPRSVDSAANLEQSRLVIGTLEARALPSEQAS